MAASVRMLKIACQSPHWLRHAPFAGLVGTHGIAIIRDMARV